MVIKYLYDATVTDGSVVIAGSFILKQWRVQNNGDTAWPVGCQLLYLRGDIIPAADQKGIVQVPSAEPQQIVDVGLWVQIPVGKTSRIRGEFIIRTPDLNLTGPKLWIEVIARAPGPGTRLPVVIFFHFCLPVCGLIIFSPDTVGESGFQLGSKS